MLDEDRMRRGHWLGSLLQCFDSAGWMTGGTNQRVTLVSRRSLPEHVEGENKREPAGWVYLENDP